MSATVKISAAKSAIAELKALLANLYGDRFAGLYLYGSYARGDFNRDSDIDLMLLLKGEVNPMRELDRLSPILSEICLRHDVLVTVYPAPVAWLTTRISPLFENVRREGVAV